MRFRFDGLQCRFSALQFSIARHFCFTTRSMARLLSMALGSCGFLKVNDSDLHVLVHFRYTVGNLYRWVVKYPWAMKPGFDDTSTYRYITTCPGSVGRIIVGFVLMFTCHATVSVLCFGVKVRKSKVRVLDTLRVVLAVYLLPLTVFCIRQWYPACRKSF